MIVNVLLFCFIGLAIILWGHYGLFSAFQHLVITIASGALAFALWEPLVMGFLIHRMPGYAWGVGLLAPFVLATLGMRALQDTVVRVNMRFENLVNIVGGGLCGLLIGILTAGLVIIGIGMLPIGPGIIDYQPIKVRPNGQLEGNVGSGLLLPVDRWTGGFFSNLSRGTFSPWGGEALASHRPSVAKQAILVRQHPDPLASTVAQPGSVKVSVMTGFTATQVDELTGRANGDPRNLLLLSTAWNVVENDATFDRDGGLRVAPSQVRLQISPDGTDRDIGTLHAPIGVCVQGGESTRFTDDRAVAYTKLQSNAQIVWAFRVNPSEKPIRLFVRHLRITLPGLNEDATSRKTQEKYIHALLGREELVDLANTSTVAGNQGQGPDDPDLGEGAGAIRSGGAEGMAVSVSNQLPRELSMHHVHEHEMLGQEIYDGKGTVKLPLPTQTSRNTRIRGIHVAEDEYMVRVQLSRERAFSLPGQAHQFAAGAGAVYIQDINGHQHKAKGYAWLKVDEKFMEVFVDRIGGIRAVSNLPLRDMRPKDELHVYFILPRGSDPRKVVFSQSEQDITGIHSP